MMSDEKGYYAQQAQAASCGSMLGGVLEKPVAWGNSGRLNAAGITVYLSGPMTGIEDHNYPAFHQAAQMLRAQGIGGEEVSVINPAENAFPPGTEWHVCLRRDIHQLVECSAIYMLKGWEHSKGALLEFEIASRLGMKIYHQP